MTKSAFITIILICSQVIGWQENLSANEEKLPYTIHWDISKISQIGTINPVIGLYDTVWDFIVDDFDHDFQQEIGILRSDDNHRFYLFVREIDTNALTFETGTPIQNHLDLNLLREFKNIDNIKCLTYRVENEQGFIDLFDAKLNFHQTIPTIRGWDKTGNGHWDGNLYNAEFLDFNLDGRKDVLVHFNTGADEEPRAIYGYDIITKQCIFKKHFAPMLHHYKALNIDNTPDIEIIVSLADADDGPLFGEFHRDSSYLAILNNNGSVKKKWSYFKGSSYVNFDIFDINGDQYADIVTGGYSCSDNAKLLPLIRIIDGATLSILSEYEIIDSPLKAVVVKVLDLEYDGKPEILVHDEEGNTGIFQYNLHKDSIEFKYASTYTGEKKIILNDDLNGDGTDELFFTSSNPPYMIITNNKLHPLACFPMKSYDDSNKKFSRLSTSTYQEKQYIFLDDFKLFKAIIPVEQVFPPPAFRFNWFGIKFNWGFAQFLGVYFLILLVVLLPVVLFMRLKKSVLLPESNRIGWLITTPSGKIKKYSHTFLKLTNLQPLDLQQSIFKLTNKKNIIQDFVQLYISFSQAGENHYYKEIQSGLPGKRRIFGVELFRLNYKSKNSPVLLLVMDLTDSKITEQVQIWASMAQRVAHKIKTPLGTILLAIQRLQKNYHKNSPELSGEYDKLAITAINEIERVRETINVFMKIARLDSPNFQEGELSNILNEAIQEYSRRLPIGVNIKTCLDTSTLNVKIDIKHFKEAIFNIFDNAVTAMDSKGQIQVSTTVEASPLKDYGGESFAILEITDNGKGMTEDELKNLFIPGFTTSKHGSGMGLVIAKNIIQNHNGKIDVYSTKDIGTTFTIKLPLKSA